MFTTIMAKIGRTDLYHVGEYTCTPSTEHYAPDCREAFDWYVVEAEQYTEILFDDGRRVILTRALCACDVSPELCKRGVDGKLHEPSEERCRKRELWKEDEKTTVIRWTSETHNNQFFRMEQTMIGPDLLRPNHSNPVDGMTRVFAYRVMVSKLGQRYMQIEGEGPVGDRYVGNIEF